MSANICCLSASHLTAISEAYIIKRRAICTFSPSREYSLTYVLDLESTIPIGLEISKLVRFLFTSATSPISLAPARLRSGTYCRFRMVLVCSCRTVRLHFSFLVNCDHGSVRDFLYTLPRDRRLICHLLLTYPSILLSPPPSFSYTSAKTPRIRLGCYSCRYI
jgi:hypothetical protein